MDSFWKIDAHGIRVRVKVRAGSGVNVVVGPRNDELIVKVRSPAQKGRANRDLISLMAEVWGVPKRSLTLVSGLRSTHKHISLSPEYRGSFEKWIRNLRPL